MADEAGDARARRAAQVERLNGPALVGLAEQIPHRVGDPGGARFVKNRVGRHQGLVGMNRVEGEPQEQLDRGLKCRRLKTSIETQEAG